MTRSRKPQTSSIAAEGWDAAEDEHLETFDAEQDGSPCEQDTLAWDADVDSEPTECPAHLVLWWMTGLASPTFPFLERSSKSIALKHDWLQLDVGEFEDFSDFLRSMDARELDELELATVERALKLKLQNN